MTMSRYVSILSPQGPRSSAFVQEALRIGREAKASKEAAGHAATAAEEIRSVKEEMRTVKGEQQ
jgi:hypothetical protein